MSSSLCLLSVWAQSQLSSGPLPRSLQQHLERLSYFHTSAPPAFPDFVCSELRGGEKVEDKVGWGGAAPSGSVLETSLLGACGEGGGGKAQLLTVTGESGFHLLCEETAPDW